MNIIDWIALFILGLFICGELSSRYYANKYKTPIRKTSTKLCTGPFSKALWPSLNAEFGHIYKPGEWRKVT